jgi:hypothetical protein
MHCVDKMQKYLKLKQVECVIRFEFTDVKNSSQTA